MEQKITNKQLQEALTQINLLLGSVSVTGDSVFIIAECRNALKQLIPLIPEDKSTEIESNILEE